MADSRDGGEHARAAARRCLEAEVKGYDEVVARYRDESDPTMRVRVAEALVEKSALLWRLGRSEDAVLVCDEVLAWIGRATEPVLVEQAARALWSKGTALAALRRFREAVLAYDEVLVRGDAESPELRRSRLVC